MAKKVSYVVWMNGNPPYCKVTYTDGDHKIVHQGEKGYSGYKAAALRPKKR
jgi:hypothetical protein